MLKKFSGLLLTGCFVFALVLGCGDGAPENNLRIVMKNQTGMDLMDFVLDYGTDRVSYSIFTKDYVFSANPHITENSVLHLSYREKDGTVHDFDLDCTVKPAHNQGRLDLTFLPDDEVEVEFQGMRDTEVPKDGSDILAQAKARFERLTIGMSAEETGEIIGFETRDGDRKYSWGKNFGYHGDENGVELAMHIHDDVLVRISLSYPNKPSEKGKFINEAGISLDEWNALPKK